MVPLQLAPALLLLTLTAFSGCGPTAPVDVGTAGREAETAGAEDRHEPAENGVRWFSGTVDEAFRLAAEQNRPLYFYWGAVWCPPCQEIKNTVFKSSSFIGLSDLFIPVYLDGDSARAQGVGERFAVQGYPTMIVFNSAGREVTRIPGGIEIARYSEVLELALNHLQPVDELVRKALEAPGQLGVAEFTQLAFYSWGQDNGAVPPGQATAVFAALAEQSHAYPVPGARLFLQSLVSAVEEDEQARLPEQQAVEARRRLQEILQKDELALASWEYLTYYSVPLIKLVRAGEGADPALRELWAARTAALRKAPSLTTADRLAGWFPATELFFEFNPEGELPRELIGEIQADVAWADGITQSPYARQSVMYIAESLLESAHLDTRAEALLLAELERSQSPYYFMSGLAGIAERRGDSTAAVGWLERAYLEAEGPATRLQWGAAYVRGVMRMQPERKQLVAERSAELLAIVDDDADLFSGRNFRVLKRLVEALAEWRGRESDVAGFEPFLTQLRERCGKVDAASVPGVNCRRLVSL